MSSNLLKRDSAYVKENTARIIDSNVLMEKYTRQQFKQEPTLVFPQSEETEPDFGNLSEIVAEDAGIEAILQEPSADELRSQAMAEIEEMRAQAERELEETRQRTLEQAKEEGYRQGQEKAQAEMETMRRELEQKEQELEQSYAELLNELEPKMVDTLTGIYEYIFHMNLSSCKDVVLYLITCAMRKAENVRNYIIHVSKEDYPYVSMQKNLLISEGAVGNAQVDVIEDNSLSASEALVETESGILDCSIDTELDELKKKLRLMSYEKSV